MKLITPKYEIVSQGEGLEGMYKQIELCGRISHKSEDKITDTSYKKFIDMMRRLQHYATFEHGTVYLKIEESSDPIDEVWKNIVDFYERNPYSKVKYYDWTYYITTNYRVIVENNRNDDMKYLCEPTEWHEKRYTVIFTCDLGVSREFNRHRVNSPLEESTRYCDYTMDKFEKQLNIMIPIWLENRVDALQTRLENTSLVSFCKNVVDKTNEFWDDIDYWLFANMTCEFCYQGLIDRGWKAQQARNVLPLDTKTTLAHTAFESDWKHFFDLRALGTTGEPHPSAKELAEPLMESFEKMKNNEK